MIHSRFISPPHVLGAKNPLPYEAEAMAWLLGCSHDATDERTDDTPTICGLHRIVNHLVWRTRKEGSDFNPCSLRKPVARDF